MHHFNPDIYLPGEQPADTKLSDKFGGLPEGLPAHLWPVCANCGGPQSFGAQFEHDAERLDLGRPGRRIYLFQCGNPDTGDDCETWDAESGTNAALVVEPEALITGVTIRPSEAALETEVIVGAWRRHEAPAGAPTGDTRLGGAPWWIQSDDEIDTSTWRFLGQLNDFHEIAGDTLAAANYGCGLAYFFLEKDCLASVTPRARILWQC